MAKAPKRRRVSSRRPRRQKSRAPYVVGALVIAACALLAAALNRQGPAAGLLGTSLDGTYTVRGRGVEQRYVIEGDQARRLDGIRREVINIQQTANGLKIQARDGSWHELAIEPNAEGFDLVNADGSRDRWIRETPR